MFGSKGQGGIELHHDVNAASAVAIPDPVGAGSRFTVAGADETVLVGVDHGADAVAQPELRAILVADGHAAADRGDAAVWEVALAVAALVAMAVVFIRIVTLPESAGDTARRIGPVAEAAGITSVPETVRRTQLVDVAISGGIQVVAADETVLGAVSGRMAHGRFLDGASSTQPTVVLGADAARRLGIDDLDPRPRVWLGGQWFVVIGILEPTPLAPDLDSAALIGYPVAKELFSTTRSPTTLYVRTVADQVENVRGVLARSIDPESPNEVDVARPSEALEARAATDEALRNLLLSLGAVALVVGGVGITNVMVISVLERRSEIGVRRAIGARRSHIAAQFLTEATVLAAIGSVAGVGLGAAVTTIYARSQGWLVDVPLSALAAGAGTALAVGLVAGVSPAVRAARLDPAEALRPA